MKNTERTDRAAPAWAWRNLAAAVRDAKHGRDYGELDADMAYMSAIDAVGEAAERIADALDHHSQDDSVGQVVSVERVPRDMSFADAIHSDEATQSLNSRVLGKTKIHIPRIKQGKLVLVLNDEGGDLTVEVSFVE